MAESLNTPVLLKTPIADKATSDNIMDLPLEYNEETDYGIGGQDIGFPTECRLPIKYADGTAGKGRPPKMQIMNMMMKTVSSHSFYAQNGGTYTFSQQVSDAINGYPKGSVLWYAPENGVPYQVESLLENNTNNFNNDPTLIDGVKWRRVGSAPSDNVTINENSNQELQAIGVVDGLDNEVKHKFVSCTEEEYQAMKQAGTLEIGTYYSTDGYVSANVKSFRNVADIFYTMRLDDTLNGAVGCDGTEYDVRNYTGENSIGVLLANNKVPYCTYAEYQAEITAHGVCGFIAWDGGNKFKVPTLNDVYIEASNTNVAEFGPESLPNIKGQGIFTVSNDAQGAVYASDLQATYQTGSAGTLYKPDNGFFDASRSSSTYQDNAKVKTDRIKYRAMIQLATQITDTALATVENKADKSLSNTGKITKKIIYIPQDVIYEISNNLLTIKAGTKVHYLDGSFDILDNDLTYSTSASGELFITYSNGTGGFLTGRVNSSTIYSGDTARMNSLSSAVDNSLFYNVDDKKAYFRQSGAWTDNGKYSLPLVVINSTAGVLRLKEVFNGFGYVDLMAFAYQGVQYISGKGFDNNGYKTETHTVNDLLIETRDSNSVNNQVLVLNSTSLLIENQYIENDTMPTTNAYTVWFSPLENKTRYNPTSNTLTSLDDWLDADLIFISNIGTGTAINGFKQKSVYKVLTSDTPHIIESRETATGGYNVYSNGYYEEWGTTEPIASGAYLVTYYQKVFKEAKYSIYFSNRGIYAAQPEAQSTIDPTVSGFSISNGSHYSVRYMWKASGFLASNQY